MLASMLHYHYLNFVSSSQNIKIGNTEFLDNLKKKKLILIL